MPSSIKRCLVLALGVFAVAAPISAQAAAPEPGVTFDPNTPAGKEYAIPIVQGRADGTGTGSGNQKGAANTPFGIGIKPPGGGHGGGGGVAAAAGMVTGVAARRSRVLRAGRGARSTRTCAAASLTPMSLAGR